MLQISQRRRISLLQTARQAGLLHWDDVEPFASAKDAHEPHQSSHGHLRYREKKYGPPRVVHVRNSPNVSDFDEGFLKRTAI